MKQFFIATSNKGKQAEIEAYAQRYGDAVRVAFPDAVTSLQVDESGRTFEENALLKAQDYREAINDDSYIYVGDDSGIKIPALHGEPGVFTRRWAGYEMSDEEILKYCLEKMAGLTGDNRQAFFETVLAALLPDGSVRYFRGTMKGRILESPLEIEAQPGFPFRSIFWVDGIDMPIFRLHSLPFEERRGFLTHREAAFKQLFMELS